MNEQRTYGVTRNLRSEIRLQGSVTLNDAAVYAIFTIVALLLGNLFPDTQANSKMVFYGVMAAFALWLTIKPPSNPLKRNYQIMFFMLRKTQTQFFSLDYYRFENIRKPKTRRRN
ncbi:MULTISPECIES: DUF5592 family protein [Liquorilactobacillus]|uniref:DUF5592 family protein n=1 Tax=Liquorilactobacillus TaxID=2767888 RepID=UPI001CBD8DF7|nr:DUF5592 family protein [Liquorilactobacillus hordei]MBZ2406648.1 hypothetical protein [Liquorilactobacillus hordei]